MSPGQEEEAAWVDLTPVSGLARSSLTALQLAPRPGRADSRDAREQAAASPGRPSPGGHLRGYAGRAPPGARGHGRSLPGAGAREPPGYSQFGPGRGLPRRVPWKDPKQKHLRCFEGEHGRGWALDRVATGPCLGRQEDAGCSPADRLPQPFRDRFLDLGGRDLPRSETL